MANDNHVGPLPSSSEKVTVKNSEEGISVGPSNASLSVRPYRSRRSRPCDFCRRRKARCDMLEEGICALCKKMHANCTFVAEPAKRKRTDERSTTNDHNNSVDSAGLKYRAQTPTLPQGSTAAYNNNDSRFSSAPPDSTSPDINNSRKRGRKPGGSSSGSSSSPKPPHSRQLNVSAASFGPPTMEEIDKQKAEEDAAFEKELKGGGGNNDGDDNEYKPPPPFIPDGFDSSVLLGLSGDQDPYLLQYYKYDDKEAHTFIKHAVRRVQTGPEMPIQFLAIKDSERDKKLQAEVDEQWRRVDSMASKFEERLLALYFRFAYPTYPIVDKTNFYHDYYHNRRNINVGLLAGLLALSCIWWKYDPYLCVNVMPKGLNLTLYKECAIALEREEKYPSLASVQCLLLLLQKRLGPSDNAETYNLHNQIARLVSISHNLGLHLDCSDWSILPAEKRLRLKLWTTVYIMEKWTSVNTGRPSLLNSNNSTVKMNYNSDENSAQLFVQMYRLTLLLDDITNDLYSLRYMKQRYHNVESTRAKVNEYFDRLQQWRDELPEELKDMQSAPEGEFCKNGTINLAALTVEVLLHKIRLHPIGSGLIPKPLLREYRAHAYDTIQRVITFTSEITHSHLHAFWYSTTRLNFSTVAHFIYFHHITSLTTQEFKDTHETLRKWLFALRILSQGWEEGTGLAALRMDTVFWMGQDLFVEDTPGLNGEYATTTSNTDEIIGDVNNSGTNTNNNNTAPTSGANSTNGGGDDPIDSMMDKQDAIQEQEETYGAADYYYPIGPQFHYGNDNSGGVHNVHNPFDDDMILLNEDIMPQSAQTQLLETHSVPNPQAFASIYNYPVEYFPPFNTNPNQQPPQHRGGNNNQGFYPPNFPDPFQDGASTGLTPEPAPDSTSYFESISRNN